MTAAPAPPRTEERAKIPPAEKPDAPTADTIPSRPRPEFPEPYKFDVHQYRALSDEGILTPDDRVELIYGEIVAMSALSAEHMATVDSSSMFWVPAVGDRAIVRVQGSIRLNEWNEPHPDIALLKRRADFYRSRTAGPDDVLLIVEVAESSLEYDREIKLRLYAEFAIPETWIANIRARTVEVYTDPVDGEYTERRTFRHGQTATPAAFPDVELPVSDVIGGLPDAEG